MFLDCFNLVERPYKVPLNTFGCILFVTPPSLFVIYLMLVASKMTYVYFALLSVLGVAFHVMQKVVKHYHLVDYVEAPKRVKRTKTKSPEKKSDLGNAIETAEISQDGNDDNVR